MSVKTKAGILAKPETKPEPKAKASPKPPAEDRSVDPPVPEISEEELAIGGGCRI